MPNDLQAHERNRLHALARLHPAIARHALQAVDVLMQRVRVLYCYERGYGMPTEADYNCPKAVRRDT